jgi:predicted nucleic acid-binding protein
MIMLRYLDASCLVKLVIGENGSSELRTYFFQNGVVCATTTFCFYEALGVLKAKWVNKKRPDKISEEQYLAGCEELCSLVEDQNIQLEEISFYDRETFRESEQLASVHQLICPVPFNW